MGGVETLSFPTVQGRYVRMYGEQRATQYGYSLFEFQVYDVAQCGAASERYTILNSSTVLDNVSGLTWQRGLPPACRRRPSPRSPQRSRLPLARRPRLP